jgi:hypothetical protein
MALHKIRAEGSRRHKSAAHLTTLHLPTEKSFLRRYSQITNIVFFSSRQRDQKQLTLSLNEGKLKFKSRLPRRFNKGNYTKLLMSELARQRQSHRRSAQGVTYCAVNRNSSRPKIDENNPTFLINIPRRCRNRLLRCTHNTKERKKV